MHDAWDEYPELVAEERRFAREDRFQQAMYDAREEAVQGRFAELAHYADEDTQGFLNDIAHIEFTDGHDWHFWQSVYENQLLDHGADCSKCGATESYGLDLCSGPNRGIYPAGHGRPIGHITDDIPF